MQASGAQVRLSVLVRRRAFRRWWHSVQQFRAVITNMGRGEGGRGRSGGQAGGIDRCGMIHKIRFSIVFGPDSKRFQSVIRPLPMSTIVLW